MKTHIIRELSYTKLYVFSFALTDPPLVLLLPSPINTSSDPILLLMLPPSVRTSRTSLGSGSLDTDLLEADPLVLVELEGIESVLTAYSVRVQSLLAPRMSGVL